MYASRNEYDRGVNTFSPEGRLFQVEYALGAVKLGSTAIGVQVSEGVVLITEKRLTSPLMEPTADLRKVIEIDKHIGCASSGIIADARTMIDHARAEAQNHWFTFNEPIPIQNLVRKICNLALDFSGVNENRKKVMSRPFGVALLVAGVDTTNKPALWMTDPSGTATQYMAAAVGAAYEGAETLLQEKYDATMTLAAAQEMALVVLRQVMEEKLNAKNVEMMIIDAQTKQCHVLSTEELQTLVAALPAQQLPSSATQMQQMH